jgi:hypothetical protein
MTGIAVGPCQSERHTDRCSTHNLCSDDRSSRTEQKPAIRLTATPICAKYGLVAGYRHPVLLIHQERHGGGSTTVENFQEDRLSWEPLQTFYLFNSAMTLSCCVDATPAVERSGAPRTRTTRDGFLHISVTSGQQIEVRRVWQGASICRLSAAKENIKERVLFGGSFRNLLRQPGMMRSSSKDHKSLSRKTQ